MNEIFILMNDDDGLMNEVIVDFDVGADRISPMIPYP